MEKPVTKIYVSCHKNFNVPERPYLFPMQVGCALSEERFPGMLRDNDGGDEISALNRFYCELTGQYWAWKNDSADYYGFFHYRRYLDFNLLHSKKKPYLLRWLPTDKTLSPCGYDDENISRIISAHDVIVPIPEDMKVSVYDHYRDAPHHRIRDLDLVIGIIKEKYPDYYSAAEKYLGQSCAYFGNIFIMNRRIFNCYCTWLFGILAEYDKLKDTTGYSVQELRVDGYLAERLLGIFMFRLREQEECCVLELPRIHFEGMGGTKTGFFKKKVMNFLLPPGSRLRSQIKKIYRKM